MAIIIFRAHEDNDHTRRALDKLRAEMPDLQIFVLCCSIEPISPTGILSNSVCFLSKDFLNLPYHDLLSTFDERNFYSASELAVMRFFHEHPNEDYYWIIEFDVHYTGNWRDIFGALSKSRADLLGTTILRQQDIAEWVHWPTLRFKGAPLPSRQCIKSFMPFARLSNKALSTIDKLYTEGLTGHFEAAWPTACGMRGLKIEDIGGSGPYTPRRWRGKHYTNTPRSGHLCPGTFIYRPPYSFLDVAHANLPPLLWHPVKS